jgi:hypothetical protein
MNRNEMWKMICSTATGSTKATARKKLTGVSCSPERRTS